MDPVTTVVRRTVTPTGERLLEVEVQFQPGSDSDSDSDPDPVTEAGAAAQAELEAALAELEQGYRTPPPPAGRAQPPAIRSRDVDPLVLEARQAELLPGVSHFQCFSIGLAPGIYRSWPAHPEPPSWLSVPDAATMEEAKDGGDDTDEERLPLRAE